MTRQWDVYSKEGGSDYTMVNPHNLKPIFTSEHLSALIHTTYLIHPIMRSVIVMDAEQLHNDILRAISKDPIAKAYLDNLEILTVSLGLTAVSMCWMLVYSNSVYFSMCTIILSLDTSESTRLWRLFIENICGHYSKILLSTIVNLVLHAHILNHSVASLMAFSNRLAHPKGQAA
jgi:hypothetical protein